jgi:flagellar basal-body rod modification protein FlgD
MSHKVLANYTMPTVLNTVKSTASGVTAKITGGPTAKASPTTSTSTSSAGTDLGTTFLNLLSTELQNQDPTAPVDSTAMVGQMISLNQLDQLISINTAVSAVGSSTATTATGGVQSGGASASAISGTAASSLSPSAQIIAMQNQLPFDPNTLMPANSAAGNASAVSASVNSPLNAASMGFPGFDSSTSGGK